MLRSLIRLFLVVLLCGGTAVAFVNHYFQRFFHERVTESQRENMKVYAFLLNDYLDRYSGSQRSAALDKLKSIGSPGFSVVSKAQVESRFDQRALHELQQGKLIVDENAEDNYLPLADGTILLIRPNDPETVPILALAYSVMALGALLGIVLWIHHHWRDLRKLEAAARAFGSGKLATRAELSTRSNIYDLSNQFNEMAEQIEASIQHQRDMLHGISHELKTPLARLQFGLALLQSDGSPGRHLERQRALRRDVRELDELISELLTLGQLEQGAAPMSLMRVSVNELMDSVAASVADDVAQRGLDLSVDTNGAPANHVCDPKLVARALLNLIRNSVRYARRSISLQVRSAPANTLLMTVEDDGPGIPVADRTRVFEPFYRLDPSRDRDTGGFGLGLAIVRSIALLHGGEVRLEASASGGSRFQIILPSPPLPPQGTA